MTDIRDGGVRPNGYVLIVDGKEMRFETQDEAWKWWNEQKEDSAE